MQCTFCGPLLVSCVCCVAICVCPLALRVPPTDPRAPGSGTAHAGRYIRRPRQPARAKRAASLRPASRDDPHAAHVGARRLLGVRLEGESVGRDRALSVGEAAVDAGHRLEYAFVRPDDG